MATISSSTIVGNVTQHDGRRSIVERHVDNAGVVRMWTYMADADVDINALLATHAAQLITELTNNEIASNVDQVISFGSQAITKLVYSIATDNFAALRVAYQTATDRQAVMIGDFLSSLTDAQLRTAFGMTQAQVTTLRTNKLTSAASLATQLRNAVGQ